MNNHLQEFERLLTDMETALVANDIAKVNQLTAQQQTCLSDIIATARQDAELKAEIQKRLPELTRQLTVNEKLLQQGISLTGTLMKMMYQGGADHLPKLSQRVYTA